MTVRKMFFIVSGIMRVSWCMCAVQLLAPVQTASIVTCAIFHFVENFITPKQSSHRNLITTENNDSSEDVFYS